MLIVIRSVRNNIIINDTALALCTSFQHRVAASGIYLLRDHISVIGTVINEGRALVAVPG